HRDRVELGLYGLELVSMEAGGLETLANVLGVAGLAQDVAVQGEPPLLALEGVVGVAGGLERVAQAGLVLRDGVSGQSGLVELPGAAIEVGGEGGAAGLERASAGLPLARGGGLDPGV